MMVPRTLTNRLNHYPPIGSGGQVSPGFFGAPSKVLHPVPLGSSVITA